MSYVFILFEGNILFIIFINIYNIFYGTPKSTIMRFNVRIIRNEWAPQTYHYDTNWLLHYLIMDYVLRYESYRLKKENYTIKKTQHTNLFVNN